MKTAWIIMCRGFRGSEVYETEDLAREAAAARRKMSGQPWEARKIFLGYAAK